jgi:hypothetical protein
MGGPSRIDQTPVRMNTKITEDRQTPKTDFGSRMKDGMLTAGSVVASGAAAAGSMVPGGAILSAAVSGVDGLAGARSSGQQVGGGRGLSAGAAGAYGVGGGTADVVGSAGGGSGTPNVGSQQYQEGVSLLQQTQASNMQYLVLQNKMQQENQSFSTLSNVMKVRHDTAKGSIQNIH